jgi:solute carrier family 25 phosphate transporter 23/24/25/41
MIIIAKHLFGRKFINCFNLIQRTIYQVQSVDLNKKDLNLLKLWKFMILEGNWLGLWRGNFVNVIKTAPENAIRLATYEKLKKLSMRENTFTDKLACGSAAGLIATLVLYPLKTVKTIMNLGKTGEFRSIADCINQLYVKYGMRAFYRGLLANSIAIIPSAGIDLACYETFKQNYSRFRNKSEPNVIEKLFLGNVSSCIGNFVVYPLFFARTRLQSNRNPNETTLNLLLHVWRRDGVVGWYRGFLLHILKIGKFFFVFF